MRKEKMKRKGMEQTRERRKRIREKKMGTGFWTVHDGFRHPRSRKFPKLSLYCFGKIIVLPIFRKNENFSGFTITRVLGPYRLLSSFCGKLWEHCMATDGAT